MKTLSPRPLALIVGLAGLAGSSLLVGCGGAVEIESPVPTALVDLPRTCTKNTQQVSDIINGFQQPICIFDSDCPCGTNCDPNGFCTAACVTTNDPSYPCASGLSCDNWGQCVPPTAPPPPTTLPLLSVSPLAVTLDAPASGAWPTTQVTVSLTSSNPSLTVDQQPTITVSGSTSIPAACTGSATTCTAVKQSELEVACAVGAPFAQSCTLPPPWNLAATDGGTSGTRIVFVRPVAGASASNWQLNFQSDQVANAPQVVSLSRSDPKPFDGRYTGTLTLAPRDPAQAAVSVPISAFAKSGYVMLMDDAHLVAPNGRMRLSKTTSVIHTAWLVNAAGTQADVGVDVRVDSLTQDPKSGSLTGAFRVGLPYWTPNGSGPLTSETLSWSFSLQRMDALPGPGCSVGGTCPSGATCDTSMLTCVPGGPFLSTAFSAADIMNTPAVRVSGATTALDLHIASPGHVTVDAAERLFCYTGTPPSATNDLEWSQALTKTTGDETCPNTADTLPVATSLVTTPELKVAQFGTLFQSCFDDLAGTGDGKCVSLARDYPAIALLVASQLPHDRRGALLLERYVSDWSAMQGFFARDGLQSWRLDLTTQGSSTTDPAKLLDTVSAGWSVLLDQNVSTALVTLPPSLLARPDYRYSDRPIAYWPTSDGDATDVENGYKLTHDGPEGTPYGGTIDYTGSSTVSFADGPLAHDLTAIFQTSYDVFKSYQYNRQPYAASTGYGTSIMESPWLSVRFDRNLSALYEVGTMRDSPGAWPQPTGLTWSACMQIAAEQHYPAWSWNPPTSTAPSQCWTYQTIGNRAGWRAPFTASVRTGYFSSDLYQIIPAASMHDGYDRYGSDYRWYSVGAATDCQNACEADSSCVAWTWNKVAHVCYEKGNGQSFPLETPASDCVTGLSSRGRAINVQLGAALNDGQTVLGTDIRNFAANGWEDCIDACRANSGCEGWVWQKEARYCYLRKNLTGYAANPLNASGQRGGIDLVVSHQSARGTEIARTHLTDDLNTDEMGVGNSFAVVRDVATHAYRVYLGGLQAWLDKPFAELPYAPTTTATLRVARSTINGSYAKVDAVALFDTALDDLEIGAIAERTKAALANPVTRDQKTPTIANPNDEHGVGLPVSFVESIESEMALLSGYIDGQGGQIDSECAGGGATPTRDALLARAGDVMRKDAVTLSLADEMHERATHVECRRDSDCAGHAGAVCGGGHTEVDIDALAMTRSGGMTTCLEWATPSSGICVPLGSGSSLGAPGSAQATTTFTVPKTSYYVVWGLVVAPSAASDSFWIRIDNGNWTTWEEGVSNDIDGAGPSAWTWSRAAGNRILLTAGSHTISVAAREDGTVLNQFRITDDQTLLAPGVHQDVCTDASGAPIKIATSWDPRWQKSRSAVDAARAGVMQSLARLAACQNALGILPSDLPLYFREPTGINRYFASSDYLLGLAQSAESVAAQLYSAAQRSWQDQRDAYYEVDQSTVATQQRLDAVATSFEEPLSDLCGVSMTTPGALLNAFSQGTLSTTSCFVDFTKSGCQTNFNGPIRNAAAGCYRGQAGEALFAMNAAAVAVDVAHQQLHDQQTKYEAQSQQCAYLKNNAALVKAHYDHLESMRAGAGVLDTMTSIVTGASLAFAAPDPGNLSGFLKQIGTDFGFEEMLFGKSMDDENATYEAESKERDADQQETQCWYGADIERGGVKAAGLAIERAGDEFAGAQTKYLNALSKIAQLVAQGQSAIAREQGRTLIRPAFNYWLDQNIDAYEHQLAWTKRLLYMAVLAVEYESQVSTNLRAQVLNARTDLDLKSVLTGIGTFSSNTGIDGQRPQSYYRVLSLKKDILNYSDDSTGDAQLREYVRDHAQRITDSTGKLLGAGVRFAMTPDLLGNPTSCGERIWSNNVQLLTDQNLGSNATVFVRLMQENTFSSQWCSSSHATAMQTSSIRPTVNLFNPTATGTSFVDAPPWTPADIQAPVNTTGTTVPAGDITALADHGAYGSYVLIFTDPRLDLSLLKDVWLRFDYLAGPKL